MTYQIEVCIDNLESLHQAIAGGTDRIELCSSLALGGLTPSFGFMQRAAALSSIPVYAMIRPRQGDFIYDQDDIDAMLLDIKAAAQAGLQGVVFGVLTAQGHINMAQAVRLMATATECNLGVTFHRAIDQCSDIEQALEQIAQLGCERILTSGLAPNVEQGVPVLKQMVEQADGRFAIMAGAGLTADNVGVITAKTGVMQVHLSGKSTRQSLMETVSDEVKMGNNAIDDFIIPVTDSNKIAAVAHSLNR
ncbi:copper homeostasis protein cutC [Vibrio ichthyoenteri ATCC 700023]|uniref:PF03932 family protein CutC n=1 Tax=Vibrio ichthyoenteri ATCC 700023 TaxID=870968 RepID=F9RW94_9VIBR|nr:copper homeostasis protein CutC [Vibrio ichthyoenteri]EGU49347.1 copper homeostasis protein cutC [Vibrio ichthyoenteri ATCC 700023]